METINGDIYLNDDTEITGQLTISGASRVRVKAGSQTINNATWTTVQFDTEDFDNLGEFNTGTYRFTAISAGYYQISTRVLFDNVAWTAGQLVSLAIYKNGASETFLSYDYIPRTATYYYEVEGSSLLELSAGDYIEIKVYQNSGSGKAIINNLNHNYFIIHRLS